jgi:hypothetical protein
LIELRLRRAQLRLRLRERRLLCGVLEQRKHLPDFDVLAFLDHDLGQRAGYLRRDGRFAARGDVAGGLQHGGRTGCAADRRRGRRGFDLDRGAAQEPPAAGGERNQREQADSDADPYQRAARFLLAFTAVDAQLLQQIGFFHPALPRVATRISSLP